VRRFGASILGLLSVVNRLNDIVRMQFDLSITTRAALLIQLEVRKFFSRLRQRLDSNRSGIGLPGDDRDSRLLPSNGVNQSTMIYGIFAKLTRIAQTSDEYRR
jgi:hypothetical protein